MHEHLCTCLYHVQTRMYRFANSCPGGQDSRCKSSSEATRMTRSDAIISIHFPIIAIIVHFSAAGTAWQAGPTSISALPITAR